MKPLLWQYWENLPGKTTPEHVARMHAMARKNSDCEVRLVTPANVADYLPGVRAEVLEIAELAHKADMLRTQLVARYGGMWLDSDALVLRSLRPYFDLLEQSEFVGFNDRGLLSSPPPFVRVNCFLSRPGGQVVSEWSRLQLSKLPRTSFAWTEIGSDILHPLCMRHADRMTVLPFETISPVRWNEWPLFFDARLDVRRLTADCRLIMVNLPGLLWEQALPATELLLAMSAPPNLIMDLFLLAENPEHSCGAGKWPWNTEPGLRLLKLWLKVRRVAHRLGTKLFPPAR